MTTMPKTKSGSAKASPMPAMKPGQGMGAMRHATMPKAMPMPSMPAKRGVAKGGK
jgi:hypothetical protein